MITDQKDDQGGRDAHRQEDTKHAELEFNMILSVGYCQTHSPSPSVLAVAVDAFNDETGHECVEDVWDVDASRDECSPLQGRDVGDDKTVD